MALTDETKWGGSAWGDVERFWGRDEGVRSRDVKCVMWCGVYLEDNTVGQVEPCVASWEVRVVERRDGDLASGRIVNRHRLEH